MAGSPGAKVVGRLALKVLPDTSEFVPKLRAFAERVEAQVKIELPVEIDTKKARLQFLAARGQIQAAAWANPIDLDVEIDGDQAEAAALTVMQQLKGLQKKIGGLSATGGPVTTMLGRWNAILALVFIAVVAIGPALAVLVPLVAGLAFGGLAVFASWDKVSKLFKQLAPQWATLKNAVGTEMVKGLQPLISALGTKFFPVLQKGLTLLATGLNKGLTTLLKWMTSGPGLARIGAAFDAIAFAIEPFFGLMQPLTKLFVELSIAAAPALRVIGDALVRVTTQFARWLAAGHGTAAINDSVTAIGEVIKILAKSAKAAFPAISAGGKALLPVFKGIGKVFDIVMKGITPIFEFMAKHKTTMEVIGVIIGVMAAKAAILGAGAAILSGALSVLGTAFSVIMGVVRAFTIAWRILSIAFALSPIGLTITLLALLVVGLIYAYKKSEKFRAIVNTAFEAVKKVVLTVLTFITGLIQKKIDEWQKRWALLQALWTIIKTVFTNVKNAITGKLDEITTWITGFVEDVKDFFDFDLSGAGRKLMESLANGLKEAGAAAIEEAKRIAKRIKDLLPGSPVRSGPLTSWNRGGAGIRLMGLLALGIRKGGSDVSKAALQTMNRVSADLTRSGVFSPTFDASSVSGLSARMSAQVGAIVDHAPDRHAQEIVLNWETGRGVMRDIANGALGAREFTAQQAAAMGGTR